MKIYNRNTFITVTESLSGAFDARRHTSATQTGCDVLRLSETRQGKPLLPLSVACKFSQIRMGLGDRTGRVRGVFLCRWLPDQLSAQKCAYSGVANVCFDIAMLFANEDEFAATALFRQGSAGDIDCYTQHGCGPVFVLVEKTNLRSKL